MLPLIDYQSFSRIDVRTIKISTSLADRMGKANFRISDPTASIKVNGLQRVVILDDTSTGLANQTINMLYSPNFDVAGDSTQTGQTIAWWPKTNTIPSGPNPTVTVSSSSTTTSTVTINVSPVTAG